MSGCKPTTGQIQETIERLRETAKLLLARGQSEKAAELMVKADRLEDAVYRLEAA